MEEEFGTLTRGKKHTTPKKELDVEKLQQAYQTSGYHRYQRGREISSKDHAADYATKGCLKLQGGKILRKWIDLRTFERATTENWEDVLDEDDSGREDQTNN